MISLDRLLLRNDLNEAAARTHYRETPQRGKPWVLFGSTVLLQHGLRDRVGDVDVFVAPSIWQYLTGRLRWSIRLPDADDPPFLEARDQGLTVHAFYAWTLKDPEVDADQCRRAAVNVRGWWCSPLHLVRMHKAMSIEKHLDDPRQAKHAGDILAIDSYIAAQGVIAA